jgi:sugar lactone lactonase YvrE
MKKLNLSLERLETRDTPSVTLFDTDTPAPAQIATTDTAGVELGVRFTADVTGAVDQVRFYRGAGTSGAFTASLWAADGTLLATGSRATDLGDGWVSVALPSTAVTAGRTYVASYHAPGGQYAYTYDFFAANPTDAGPVQAAGAGSGVYAYGGAPQFPTQTFRDSNYWVTPVYTETRVLYVTDGTTLQRVDAAGNRTPVLTNVSTTELAFDAIGNVYTAAGNVVRKFAPTGADLGTAATLPSGALGPVTATAIAVEADGNLLVAGFNGALYRFSPAGTLLGTVTTGLNNPIDIELTADGTIYVSNLARSSAGITRVAPNGVVSQTGPGFVADLAVAADGSIYATRLTGFQASTYQLVRLSPAGEIAATLATGLPNVSDLELGPDGNLYVRAAGATGNTAAVRVFGPTGTELAPFGGTFAGAFGALEFAPYSPPPASLFPTTAPPASALIASTDTAGVELGVKFTVDTAGTVDQVRFYRGAGTSGAFTASLWAADGTLLATGTAARDLGNGWVGVSFNPVAVTAGQTYVASYYAPGGQYAYTYDFFAANPTDAGPVQAVTPGSGVYAYGGGGVFPTENFRDSNYWVAPVFTPRLEAESRALYVSDGGTGSILRADRLGNRTTFATGLSTTAPLVIAADVAGNVYATSGNAVRKFAPTGADLGTVVTLPSGALGPVTATAIALEASGNLLVTGSNGTLYRYSPTGALLGTPATGLLNPNDIEVAADGSIYVANLAASTNGITRIAPDGSVTGFGPGLVGRIAIAPDGTVYATRLPGRQSSTYDVVQLSPAGAVVRTLASGRTNIGDLEVGPDGNVYFRDGGAGTVRVFAPTGAELPLAATGLTANGALTFGLLPVQI